MLTPALMRFPVLIAFGLFSHLGLVGAGEISEAVLEELAEAPLGKSLQITYTMTNMVEPRNVDPAEVTRKVDDLRAQIAGAAGTEQILKSYRKTLEEKSEQLFDGLFVMDTGFLANRHFDPINRPMWEIRYGPDFYRLNSDIMTIVSDPKEQTKNFPEIARDTIGRLGQLDAQTLEELKNGQPVETRQGDELILTEGNLTVKFKAGGERLQLHSIERVDPTHQQRLAVIFENYEPIEGRQIPCKVTDIMETQDSVCTRVYAIDKVEIGGTYSVPIVNADFGTVMVTDKRKTPSRTYEATGKLPKQN